jgi:aminoglycoside 6'-N-acetyltransferase
MSAYDFRPFLRADLPMVAAWLRTPELVRWWGDPQEQLALLSEDLDEPRMQQWIVTHYGPPFAYVQTYPAHAWPQPHLPDGALAIDAFIGEPAMLGCGHGQRFLRVFAEKRRAEGTPVVAIDPARDDHRARRAYANAGFVEVGTVQVAVQRVVLMLFR